jgi:hypothetical protein
VGGSKPLFGENPSRLPRDVRKGGVVRFVGSRLAVPLDLLSWRIPIQSSLFETSALLPFLGLREKENKKLGL